MCVEAKSDHWCLIITLQAHLSQLRRGGWFPGLGCVSRLKSVFDHTAGTPVTAEMRGLLPYTEPWTVSPDYMRVRVNMSSRACVVCVHECAFYTALDGVA